MPCGNSCRAHMLHATLYLDATWGETQMMLHPAVVHIGSLCWLDVMLVEAHDNNT